ncbi:MAG TPA: GntR family transcriptional regulator [Actinomycetota bacterium]|jgi:GntR family transcriptional regulator
MSPNPPFAGAAVLDRGAPTPLYFQLREALLREIRERGMKTGDRLPTESEIERSYGVSRATIRQALAALEHEGVVRRVQGLGTFVASPKIRHVPRLQSFSELARSQGFVPSHRMLSSSLEPVAEDVADDLAILSGSEGRHLVRLLLADERVVGLADTWLPHDLIAENEELFEQGRLDRGSLYELLQRPPVSLVLHRAEETISASVADDALAGRLECEPGEPVLVVKRISWTPDDRVVESTRLLFVSERYEYRVAMQPPVGSGGRA